MKRKVRNDGVPIRVLWKLFLKNLFSVFYFVLVGLILAVIYTQFLLKPTYTAIGNIENVGLIGTHMMPSVVVIAQEDETLERVTVKMNIPASNQEEKKDLIRAGLNVSNYSTTTLKITISYKGTSKNESELIVNYIIDVTIERFIEKNPGLENKLKKQNEPIIAKTESFSSKTIYSSFILLGGVFGIIVGVGGDLINRRLLFKDDLEEYKVSNNVIDLNLRKEVELPISETTAFKKGVVLLQDEIEGAVRTKKAKIIGVVNFGYESYDTLSVTLAENLAYTGFKTLVIDLDLESPIVHETFNIDNDLSIINLLNDKKITPTKINEFLSIIPSKKYSFPARFLKDERLHKLIKENAEKYDYVIVNVPIVNYYAPILLNYELIDMLLINTSFEGTTIKKIDSYLANIDEQYNDKLFINAIDSRVKKDYSKIIDKIKGFFKRNKKAEGK